MRIKNLILIAVFVGLLITVACYVLSYYHKRVEGQQMIGAFQHFAQDKIVKDGLPVLTVDFATSAHDLVVAGFLSSNDYQHFDHKDSPSFNWMVTTFRTNWEIQSSGVLPSGRFITLQFPLTNVTYK
jgi:hypothetical protein